MVSYCMMSASMSNPFGHDSFGIYPDTTGSESTQIEPPIDTWDFTDILDRLKREYKRKSHPVVVNFRKLVPIPAGADRATHLFHSYPAKLLVNIPVFFLRCKQLGPIGTLRDPFCGTGTVLVEGALAGWKVSGADSNPLARIITRGKLTYIGEHELINAGNRVCNNAECPPAVFSPVVNVDLWFSKTVQQQLGGLVKAINSEPRTDLRQFLKVCLSSIVRRVSFADPRLPVPVTAKSGSTQRSRAANPSVRDVFLRSVEDNARRIQSLRRVDPTILRQLTVSSDARGTPDESGLRDDIDLAIASPPYVGAQKYIRASSLSIGWLGLGESHKLRPLEQMNIGREHFRRAEYAVAQFKRESVGYELLEQIREINPLRAHIAATYLNEMRLALREVVRRVRVGGHLVLVSGNNTVVGQDFPTSAFLAQLSKAEGLSLELELVDDIRSRCLMTKRNRTAGLIPREHVQVFSKL